MKKTVIILLCLFLIVPVLEAQEKTISDMTSSMQKFSGFFDFYWDSAKGKIWLEIDKFDYDFLYVTSLPAGLGSNDIGLDRNKLGGSKIVKFHRIGPKVLLIQPNMYYRAESDNASERQAVEDAFAKSVVWGFTVAAEENGNVLIDATDMLLTDAFGAIRTLRRSNQGSFRLDKTRSAIYLPSTKNFPKNSEFEVLLTFMSENPGRFVRSVAADANSITLRERHSFVELPDDNYEPRMYDPRSSYGSLSYMDYATRFDEPIVKRFIRRHRIKKKNPNAPVSEAVEPIIYYVDRGAPEPIRTALVEGGKWWNQAFEAAGYKDAFDVRVMPEGADPMDIRYNMINWVHRSTRGWSYGSSVTDPRTGEIIKGHVALGSLRIRQDFMIAEGLLAPYENGKPADRRMQQMALARIRQLSVHEIGHTLGLSHNYTSSSQGRASVMDYPHPLIKINNDGTLDLADAYDTGVGEWDKIAILYGYQDFPDGTNEAKELLKILDDAMEAGYFTLADQDARSPGTAHPTTHLWDNGTNAVDELDRMLRIRSLALGKFSENNIRPGFPMATLEDVLVPIFMFHRYQVAVASKVLGGMYYHYNMRGDGVPLPTIIEPDEQRRALNSLLETLKPDVVGLDERILNLIPPRPPGWRDSPELFRRYTGPTLDPLAMAEIAAHHTTAFILNGQRAARLVEFHARDSRNPGLREVLDSLFEITTWTNGNGTGYEAEIKRSVDKVVLFNMLSLGANKSTSPQVRAIVMHYAAGLKQQIKDGFEQTSDKDQQAHYMYGLNAIDRFEKDPEAFKNVQPLFPPNGSPIGTPSSDLIGFVPDIY